MKTKPTLIAFLTLCLCLSAARAEKEKPLKEKVIGTYEGEFPIETSQLTVRLTFHADGRAEILANGKGVGTWKIRNNRVELTGDNLVFTFKMEPAGDLSVTALEEGGTREEVPKGHKWIWKKIKSLKEKDPTLEAADGNGTTAKPVKEFTLEEKVVGDDLLRNVKGYLTRSAEAVVRGRTRIVAISLPSRKEKTIHTLQVGPNTHSISGPDQSGRVAFVEDYFFVPVAKRRHLLKFVSVDGGKDTTIFTKPGSAMWATSPVQTPGGVIGTHLAIAPRGGNVALLSNMDARQMPGVYLHEGRLEIWSLDRNQKVKIAKITALDQPMAWFPDGHRLAYAKLTPIKQISPKGAGSELPGSYLDLRWDEAPAIFVLDVKTGKSTFLSVGWQAAISPDGKTAIITGSDNLLSVDVTTGKGTALNLPKVAYRTWDPAPVLIGIARNGTVFYRGLPLKGKRARSTVGNSPLVGPKPMLTVRVAEPATGKSAVLIPYFDPRHKISLGIAAKKPE